MLEMKIFNFSTAFFDKLKKYKFNHHQGVILSLDFAELVSDLIPGTEMRPWVALNLVKAWTRTPTKEIYVEALKKLDFVLETMKEIENNSGKLKEMLPAAYAIRAFCNAVYSLVDVDYPEVSPGLVANNVINADYHSCDKKDKYSSESIMKKLNNALDKRILEWEL